LFFFVAFLVLSAEGTLSDLLWYFGFVIALFICVVLHEAGHALTARRFGIDTRNITLLPIGGVANLEKMPENPKEEFLVAAAGPLVNVVIALLLFLIVPVGDILAQEQEVLQEELATIRADTFLFHLLFLNIVLVLFNLLPAFPMDGGRIFRALLSMKMSRIKATRIASGLGKFMAFIFFFAGLFFNIFLAIIAVFVYFGAHSENVMTQQMNLLEGKEVRDAMIKKFTILKPDETLDTAINAILNSTEQNFIIATNGQIEGVLYMEDISPVLRTKGKEVAIRQVMQTEVPTLKADEALSDAFMEFNRRNRNFFPVLDRGEIVGVLDLNNLNEFMTFRASLEQ